MIQRVGFQFGLQHDAHAVVQQASEADILPLGDLLLSRQRADISGPGRCLPPCREPAWPGTCRSPECRTRTREPEIRVRRVFSAMPRTRIVPVPAAYLLSAKTRCPSCGYPFSVSKPNEKGISCSRSGIAVFVPAWPASLTLVALHRAFVDIEVDVNRIDGRRSSSTPDRSRRR